MAFDRPSLAELVTRAIADIQTRVTGASTLLRRSVLRVLAKVQSGANHLIYGYLDYIAKQAFITTADENGLITHGTEWGIDRGEPEFAIGNTEATGTTGLIITKDLELESADGQIYIVDEDVTVVAGVATLAITAQATGDAGNQAPAAVLIFVSPPDGIDANTTVDSEGLNGGLDIEDVEDWRARQLQRKQAPPHGGAESDYITTMLEVDGVSRAWAFPLYQGVGTIGVAFVRDAETPIIASADEVAVVRAYLISHTDPVTGKTVGIPVTAEPGLVDVLLGEKAVNLTISISPKTTAIENAISAIINDTWVKYGGPGETVYLSQLQKEISKAQDLDFFRIDSPLVDTVATQTEVHVPGVYTYQNY